MESKEKRFKVVRFSFETRTSNRRHRHLITENKIPVIVINQWVETKNIRKASTGKEYAKKLVVFLNYLDQIGLEFQEATNRHVDRFVDFLIYGDTKQLKILDDSERLSYSTISQYIVVITDFYWWLDYQYDSSMKLYTEKSKKQAKKSFFYGQIYERDYTYIINRSLEKMGSKKEYIKWYDDKQIALLSNNFMSLRDEVIFRFTLEGFRIDEVLSMRLENYNAREEMIQPSRSKGRAEVREGMANALRTVALPKNTCELMNRYLQTERMVAENESGTISNTIFINLKNGEGQGKPLTYSNYYKIFKRCAERAGFDVSKVRTHSGRSTKVMQLLEHQALYPEDGITDAIIQHTFGWQSSDSIESYRDNNNQVIAKEILRKIQRRKEESSHDRTSMD